MYYIIIILAMLMSKIEAAVLSDSTLMTGFMHIDYFPDTWQKQPQINNTIPSIELNIENYFSHHQAQWLTLGFKVNGTWTKQHNASIVWEKLKIRTSVFSKILPYTHIGYSIKYLTDNPSEADIADQSQWVHGVSIRVAW